MLRSWLEELRVALELLPLWVAELLAELPERTALELPDELPLRVLVPLLRVELLLEELPLRVLVLPLWLLRVLELLPLWLEEELPLWLEEELPLRTLLEELLELLPLLRVLPLWLEELPLLTLLELELVLPLLRVLPLWAEEELLPLFRLELEELPLLRVLVLPLWLLRVEDEEVLADCLEELLLRVALLVEVLPEERVEDEEVVVERLLLPELRLCAMASAPSRSMRAAAPAAES